MDREIVYQDDMISVLCEVSNGGTRWFNYACKICGEQPSGWGSGTNEEQLIAGAKFMGWTHVENHMRQDTMGFILGMMIVKEEGRKNDSY